MKSNEEIFILSNQYNVLNDVLPVPEDRFVELDLGCGKGDLSVGLASRYPERVILAADVMIGRLRKVLNKARRNGADNLYFLRVEARHLVSIILPDSSVDRLHILCPDPWPKERHRGHRLLTSDLMAQLARILKPGGVFHFASDDVPYWEEAIANIRSSGLFEQIDNEGAIGDIADLKTEFERKWLAEGKAVPHIAFRVIK